MTFMRVRLALQVATMLLAGVAPGVAQDAPQAADTASAPAADRGNWTTLRVAKWSTAAAATGAALYGFVNNQRADERFESLEQNCASEPVRCSDRLPNGAYADAALEADYQAARSIDRHARTALILGQVGVVASVVLFIADLRNSDAPADIPYEPRTLDVTPSRDGGMSLRVNIRLPLHR
jgi:hypothetical protein